MVLISIIVPIHNGEAFIDQCFSSVLEQQTTPEIHLEVCVCNDSSKDRTSELLGKWANIFRENNIAFRLFNSENAEPQGVGFAKNKAVGVSNGTFLCFQDIDDIMLPKRIMEQYNKARLLPLDTIVGSRFKRFPENSTSRYTDWANSLPMEKLHVQIYTSHGPTVIMPTWFCHRKVFDNVGGFSEEGKGTPEDLIFFYKHLDLGGKVLRTDHCLLIYTYHAQAATFSVLESTIWHIRCQRLQQVILKKWDTFTIWNAGKQGRKLYKCLLDENKKKVVAFCDVDLKKIGKLYVPFDAVCRNSGEPIRIVHFKEATPPFVICVKINLTNGEFEKNLASLNLKENIDYVLFS